MPLDFSYNEFAIGRIIRMSSLHCLECENMH